MIQSTRPRVLAVGLLLLSGFAATLPMATQDPFLGYEGPLFPNPVAPAGEPWGLLAADFNEDGITDFASIGLPNTILLGNGDCTFDVGVYFSQGGGSGALGDFNEDGHVDIVYGTTGDFARVQMGAGDGTLLFQSQLDGPPVTDLAWGVAVADFDKDNHDDVILGFYNSGQPAFYAGNGDGTFAPGVSVGFGPSYWDIRVGDFDENGDPDFIGGDNGARVALGAGNGTFAMGGFYAMGGSPEGLLVADLNGDTHDDFITADSGTATFSVRLGNGDGTFMAATGYPVGTNPRHLALADMDNDSKDDLLVGYGAQFYVSLLTGNGDGTFNAEVQVPTISSGGPVVAEDLDGDGNLDIAYASLLQDELVVVRGHGNGSFDAPYPGLIISSSPGLGTFSLDARFADLDKDGLHDVVTLLDDGANSIAAMLADGTGAFTLSATSAAGTTPNDIGIADLDNDTNLDVIVTNEGSSNASILLGNGDGTFDPMFTIPAISGPLAIATGLFNNDANVDLAILAELPTPAAFILLGNGAAGFSPAGFAPVGSGPETIETGDFNEDGNVDLAVLNVVSEDLSILLGVGNGTFQPEVRYGTIPFPRGYLNVEDVDGDNRQDLIVADANSDRVLFGAGDGTFGPVTALDTETFSFVYKVGDVDGDGIGDLVGGINHAHVQLGQSGGSFGSPAFYSGNVRAEAILLEDTNGDGKTDLVLASGYRAMTFLNIAANTFNFMTDKATLGWPAVDSATSYNVYRGLISQLLDADDDGLPDGGYGDCMNGSDPNLTDRVFIDAAIPPVGDGYYYLIAAVDGAGERLLGSTSDGLARVPSVPCP